MTAPRLSPGDMRLGERLLNASDWNEAAKFIQAHFSRGLPATHRSSGLPS